MKRQEYHVVPRGDRWAVKRDNASRASGLFDNKQDAINAGRDLSKGLGAELVIHGRNGQIQNSNSYGNDPCPPHDTVQ